MSATSPIDWSKPIQTRVGRKAVLLEKTGDKEISYVVARRVSKGRWLVDSYREDGVCRSGAGDHTDIVNAKLTKTAETAQTIEPTTAQPAADGRFVSPFPPPEGRRREIYTVENEEIAEINAPAAALMLSLCSALLMLGSNAQVRASKLLRFGEAEIQPGQLRTNRERLEDEIGDYLGTLDVAAKEGLLDVDRVEAQRVRKVEKLAKFLQHAA